MTHVWPDGSELNAQLRDSILAHARRHPGTDLTNVGGWHSEPETLEFCGNAGQRLIRHLDAMIKEATLRLYAEFARPPQRLSWILSAWANVNRRGDFNQLHTHPGASWSGVYYVDHGESNPDADGTAIHFSIQTRHAPISSSPSFSASKVVFKPEPGLMILFPSYVRHPVLPHRGDRPRISIAFNVRREPFP